MKCHICHSTLQIDNEPAFQLPEEKIFICSDHVRLFIKENGTIPAYRFLYEDGEDSYMIHQLHIDKIYLYHIESLTRFRRILALDTHMYPEIENEMIRAEKIFTKLKTYLVFS